MVAVLEMREILTFTYILSILLIIFTYLFVYSTEKTLLGKTTLNNTIRETILDNWQKLPIKWFDWLKWVFVIGVLSIMEQKNSSIVLQSAILISYIAIATDLYYEVYNLFFRFFIINLKKSLDTAYRTLDDVDKERNEWDELVHHNINFAT